MLLTRAGAVPGRRLGRRQQILGAHADGAHRAFAGCLAGFGRALSSGKAPAMKRRPAAVAADKARLQQVHRADEAGDEFRGGPVVERRRRRDLLDAALVHDDDAVGDRQRLGLVVRDHDEGGAELRLQPLQLDLHLLAQMRVERRQRLVEQQHARLADDGAGERHALALAAGQLRHARAESCRRGRPCRALSATRLLLLGAGELAQRQAEADILRDVHMREQRIVLEHGVDRPVERPERRDVAALEQHACRSTGSRSRRSRCRLVVLPQPEGPSSVRNSPRAMSRSTASRPTMPPGKIFETASSRTSGVRRHRAPPTAWSC